MNEIELITKALEDAYNFVEKQEQEKEQTKEAADLLIILSKAKVLLNNCAVSPVQRQNESFVCGHPPNQTYLQNGIWHCEKCGGKWESIANKDYLKSPKPILKPFKQKCSNCDVNELFTEGYCNCCGAKQNHNLKTGI